DPSGHIWAFARNFFGRFWRTENGLRSGSITVGSSEDLVTRPIAQQESIRPVIQETKGPLTRADTEHLKAISKQLNKHKRTLFDRAAVAVNTE
ncbi:hypothetical protein, partial [Pseudomonas viridiflava]|uniref:hypothetical protein n=1 Tax=Pseudomonas viridiflava TaxID=33069 RepID=UPI00197ECD72